jgi:MFS family permease
VLHRGWWLVASVYMVADAGLSPAELVVIGVLQGVVALVFEIPAGVLADTISRKWSLVVSHALMGTAMLTTGLVTTVAPLALTQMLWGLSWTFASGADVAWITDELDDPVRIPNVLLRSGRAQLTGAAAGLAGLGALASLTQRSTAIVIAGSAMLLLGLYVAIRFRETRFVPASTRRWSASWSILTRGAVLVRRSRAILLMFAATFLVNGASDAAGRLQPKRLYDIGYPLVWFTVLGVLTLLVGAVALRLAEAHANLGGYMVACAAGALGLAGLAFAPEKVSGGVGVLLAAGIAVPLTRTIGTIWVNSRTTGDVRATVHSFLAQAEYFGEIVCGFAIAAVARYAGLATALVACGSLYAVTILVARRARPSPGDFSGRD